MTVIVRQAVISDKESWNNYIFSNDQATPYHNYSWVQSVEQTYGFKNISLIATDEERVVGILPIIQMRHPFSAGSLCSLPYCDVGYVVANSQKIKDELLNKLLELKQVTKSKQIEYRDVANNENIESTDTSLLTGRKVRMILPLPDSSEILLKNFKSKLRSQIRKAEKNGLTYKTGCSIELLEEFYKVFVVNMRRLGSPVHSKELFLKLLQNYQEDMLISIVYKDDIIPVGGGIVLKQGTKVSIPWASTLSEYNRLAPNMLLYWSLLKKVCDSGSREFDFGRSTYNEGTYNFKKQWGATPVLLKWSLPDEDYPDDKKEKTKGFSRKLVERYWPVLPLGMTIRLGSLVRKYISL